MLENVNFDNQNLRGISFQQSSVRQGSFRNSNLQSASFFDAECTGTDFTGANLDQANFELAKLDGANLKDAIITNAYIGSSTRIGDMNIEGADFTDTTLTKNQLNILCAIASGVNPTTGVDTRESLNCP